MTVDPNVPCDEQTGQFVILAAINPADKRPYPLKVDPATGLLVNTEMGPVTLGAVQIKDSTNALIDPSIKPSGSYYSVNDLITPLTASLVDRTFSFDAFHIVVKNEEAPLGGSVFYSLDNGTTEHELKPGYGFAFDGCKFPKIKLRGTAGGEKYSCQAWR